jgi:hypothetical protein
MTRRMIAAATSIRIVERGGRQPRTVSAPPRIEPGLIVGRVMRLNTELSVSFVIRGPKLSNIGDQTPIRASRVEASYHLRLFNDADSTTF